MCLVACSDDTEEVAEDDGTGMLAGDGDGDGELDIIETALAAGDFTQLAAALTTAELVDALQGEGPLTVFAPSDEALDAFEEANPGGRGCRLRQPVGR